MKNLKILVSLALLLLSHTALAGGPTCSDNPTKQDFLRSIQEDVDKHTNYEQSLGSLKNFVYDPSDKTKLTELLMNLCADFGGGYVYDECNGVQNPNHANSMTYHFNTATHVLTFINPVPFDFDIGREWTAKGVKAEFNVDFSRAGNTRMLPGKALSWETMTRHNVVPNPNPENYPYKVSGSFLVDEKNRIGWEHPATVNKRVYHEAVADCQSRGLRLPTEIEMYRVQPHVDFCLYPQEHWDSYILTYPRALWTTSNGPVHCDEYCQGTYLCVKDI